LAATEKILLEISDRGYGGCWLGIYPSKTRIKGIHILLNLPEKIVPLSLIVLGHPGEKKPPKNEFDRSRMSYNRWV
jgi:nitroreductase